MFEKLGVRMMTVFYFSTFQTPAAQSAMHQAVLAELARQQQAQQVQGPNGMMYGTNAYNR